MSIRETVSWRGVIAEYRDFLAGGEIEKPVTLLEGNTPLVAAERLARRFGWSFRLYFKCEGLNPTGSFKDRGMTLAVSRAVASGAQGVVCASTGNTAASASAYAARAGVRCLIVVPHGAVALGKLSQSLIHGATVVAIEGNFDQALEIVRQLADQYGLALVNSVNPDRLEGQKTGAFEICDQLASAPSHHVLPVGNAGNISAYWAGYQQYASAGRIERAPKMMGFQAAGAAPIVEGRPIANPITIATAIRIGNPASWAKAVEARDSSGGCIKAVSDEKILEAYRLLATEEGIFAEPASAASLAGVIQLAAEGYFKPEDTLVAVLTGHGLKDPASAMGQFHETPPVAATCDAVARSVGL
ncbi:MAG: threonine synthase [Acidobacteriota bacterium]